MGANVLESKNPSLVFLPLTECNLAHVDAALDRLANAIPRIKNSLIEACAATVASDGIIQEGEGELLRAISNTLDCPIPPFVDLG